MEIPNNLLLIISRTYLEYYAEKKRELNKLSFDYSVCTDMGLRKTMRKRREDLCKILLNANSMIKASLQKNLNIKYNEINDYPELIEVKRKQLFLKNSIS